MTEYARFSDTEKIQADLALRVLKLLKQYGVLTLHLGEEEKYDATLLICALQTLLVNCHQLIDAMKACNKNFWQSTVDNSNNDLGISRNLVTQNTFPGDLTRARFVKHLRNALSHPTYPDHKPRYPSTGYTTVPDTTGIISKFVFIDSPWVDRGKFLSKVFSKDQDKVKQTITGLSHSYGDNIELSIIQNMHGKYEIRRGETVYYPVFKAMITIKQLRVLAIELANYIAQPTRENWDGKTIYPLVAA